MRRVGLLLALGALCLTSTSKASQTSGEVRQVHQVRWVRLVRQVRQGRRICARRRRRGGQRNLNRFSTRFPHSCVRRASNVAPFLP